MVDCILKETHYSLQINEEVQAICEPLFNEHAITHFAYGCFYDDGSSYVLITNKEAYKFYFEKEHIMIPRVDSNLLKKNFYYIPTPELEDGYSEFLNEFFKRCGFSHFIKLIDRYNDYFEVFSYTKPETSAINYFLNNMDVLEKFKIYFKEKAQKLLEESRKNKIILPPHMQASFGGINKNKIIPPSPLLLIPQRYRLSGPYKNVYLTQKEFAIIQQLAHGDTAKQTAKKLGLSPRTVENYLQHIRIKLRAHNKQEVLKIIAESFNL